jgi:hypothetical protein
MAHYLNDLTVAYDATDEIWIAYLGNDRDASDWLGEGRTRESAALDYWYQANGANKEVWVTKTTNDHDDFWCVESLSGWDRQCFTDREEAVNWAVNKGYIVTVEG